MFHNSKCQFTWTWLLYWFYWFNWRCCRFFSFSFFFFHFSSCFFSYKTKKNHR